jgi:hypothetical protein
MRKVIAYRDFESFFQEAFIQEAVNVYRVKLIFYNPLEEVITHGKNRKIPPDRSRIIN